MLKSILAAIVLSALVVAAYPPCPLDTKFTFTQGFDGNSSAAAPMVVSAVSSAAPHVGQAVSLALLQLLIRIEAPVSKKLTRSAAPAAIPFLPAQTILASPH